MKYLSHVFIFISVLGLFMVTSTKLNAEDYNFSVSGNGNGSSNDISISQTRETEVKQENNAEVQNNVDVTANTGGNTINDNTGGNATINTGDVSVQVNITNDFNHNLASVNNCCEEPQPTNIPGQPTPTPTVPPTGGSDITPNGDGDGDGGDNGGSSSSSSSSSESSNISDVLGLAYTSSSQLVDTIFNLSGIICLISGSVVLLKARRNSF